jgi:hypothetical protein
MDSAIDSGPEGERGVRKQFTSLYVGDVSFFLLESLPPPNSPTVFNLKISSDMPFSLRAAFTAPMILSVPLWLFLL